MQNLEAVITQHPFWKGLNPQFFPLLVEGAVLVRFAAGQVVAREGEEATRFCLILGGQVALEATMGEREPVVIQTVGPGEALGWSWLFPPYRWHLNARALQDTEAVGWDTRELRAKGEANPQFGYEMACRMSHLLLQRLHATHMQLVDFYGSQG